MKVSLILGSLCFAFLFSGCGQKDTAPAGSAAASKSEAPAGPRKIEITGNDQMKFNLTTIEATAGEQLTVILTNIGTLPKEAMGHNWVLLKADADPAAFVAAAMTAKDTDYVPASLVGQVIAQTKLIGPRQSDEVTFTVPGPGTYVYLCSFPAHYMVGMKGTLVVK